MEPTALYDLISQAKAENKAVQLFSSPNLEKLEFIIEPGYEIVNKQGNVIQIDGTLIDLKFIAVALIVPNYKDRAKEMERIKQEVYMSSKSRRAEDVYPLKPEGKEYRS